MKKDILLEIGTEEIPARFLSPALAKLKTSGAERLEKAGLTFEESRVYGTPRRLAWWVRGVTSRARDVEQEFLGPAAAQAKDAGGNWTPAAQGFARSHGVTPEALGERDTDRGPRLVYVKKTSGLPTEKILPNLLSEVVTSLTFPKSMVWEEGRFAFARPLRWLVALWGTRPVGFTVAGVKAGKRTQGLRFHSRRPLEVSSPEKYVSLLRNHCVIVDPEERRRLIVQQIEHVAKSHRGVIDTDKDGALLDEVTHLVEHPVAVVGAFDPRFLEVPREVLVTSMKKHQKYFPVTSDAAGATLLPHFVAVRNGLSDNQSVVREGYERVLAARLNDAAFFFSEHSKRKLETRVADLAGIAFLSPALNLKDKTERVRRLTEHLARTVLSLGDAVSAEADRLATLMKADLTTGLVGEFPELQGVVGRLYAERDGEPAGVCRGIEEHQWPLTAEGTLPTTEAAALVAVADKADTLAGNFILGKIPSGSQDPYGLRRAAVGILRILEARRWPVVVADLVERAVLQMPESLGDRPQGQKALSEFIRQRWSALAEARDFRIDEIEAVAAVGLSTVGSAWSRLKALQEARRHTDFGPLSTAFKRAANLLKQAEKRGEGTEGAPRPDLFSDEAERVLWGHLGELGKSVPTMLAQEDYSGVLQRLVSLRGPVDDYFQKVVVMDPSVETRQNRLKTLAGVRRMFGCVADFSLLQETPSAG